MGLRIPFILFHNPFPPYPIYLNHFDQIPPLYRGFVQLPWYVYNPAYSSDTMYSLFVVQLVEYTFK